MVSSSLRIGWGLVSILATGCFIDSVGVPPPSGGSPSDGGGGSTSNFTGGAGGTAPVGGEGGAPQGGEGGAPPPPDCGDGTAVGVEQCEDGNTASNDGCSGSCQFESMCGNGVVEPTEECDQSPNCAVDCKAAANSGCAEAVGHQDPDTDETVPGNGPDNPFPIPSSAGEWGPIEICDTINDVTNPTNVYRIQIGPYPEGVFIKVHQKGNFDPVLAVYKGCGEQSGAPLFCHHADDAFVVSDVVPAGSVMFATVGDRADGGDFDMFLWFHRFWATFDSLTDFVVDPLSWTHSGGSETWVLGVTDADGAALISPPIFIGNLASFEAVAHYGFDLSDLNIAVSFDDGVTWEQEAPLANGGYDQTKWDRQTFDNDNMEQHARVRISYLTADPLGRARVLALRVQPVAPFNTW